MNATLKVGQSGESGDTTLFPVPEWTLQDWMNEAERLSDERTKSVKCEFELRRVNRELRDALERLLACSQPTGMDTETDRAMEQARAAIAKTKEFGKCRCGGAMVAKAPKHPKARVRCAKCGSQMFLSNWAPTTGPSLPPIAPSPAA